MLTITLTPALVPENIASFLPTHGVVAEKFIEAVVRPKIRSRDKETQINLVNYLLESANMSNLSGMMLQRTT